MQPSAGQYEYLDAMIQRLLVVKASMSLREMQKHLENNGMHVGGNLEFLSGRRDKVLRRMAMRIKRSIRNIQVGDYYVTVEQAIEDLWKIANSEASPVSQRRQALNDIIIRKRERLLTLTVMDVFSEGDARGQALGEKQFPDESFDMFEQAVKNNMFRQNTEPFKYLPDAIVVPKAVVTDKAKETVNKAIDFFTTLPVKNDRSLSIPKK